MTRRRMKFTGACPIGDRPPEPDHNHSQSLSKPSGCPHNGVHFKIDASVAVPVRLIGTQDEAIINGIIRATNRQTEVKEEQFYALQEFSKELELFFQSYSEAHKLYYERRTRQYDRLTIEKTRIVTPGNMIKAFAAMFFGGTP